MIRYLECYIRDHWDEFNLPFALPMRFSFLFLKGFRKAIFLLFKDNDSKPFAVLKISNDPLVFKRLLREYETLSYLSAKETVRGDIPAPLAFFEMRGHTCIFESALGGTPLVYYMKGIRTKRGLLRMKEIFNRIVDTLVTLDKPNPHHNADSKHQKFVEHGDFNPSNLHVTRNGIKIFDWEYSTLQGVPLRDLLDFALKYVLLARYLKKEIRREQPVLNDFEEAFLSRTTHSSIIWDSISLYNKKMDMCKSSVQDAFFTFCKKYLIEPDARSFFKNLDAFIVSSLMI